MFIRIQGVQHYLWGAVDQDGVVFDILVQERRNAKAAKRFCRRLLKGLQYVQRVIVTDKLRSYGVGDKVLRAQQPVHCRAGSMAHGPPHSRIAQRLGCSPRARD